MKHCMIVRIVLVVLTAFGGMVAHAQPITISAFGEQNPIMEICQLVMTEAYRCLGRTMDVKYLPAKRAIVIANNGEVDGELGRTQEVERDYPNLRRIPISIATVDIVVFTKETIFPVKDWKSLQPYTVGYVRGIKVVEHNLAEGTNAEAIATLEQAFKKLDAGRNDVIVDARFPGLKTLNELGLTGISILEPPLVQVKMFHYLHVKNQHLIEPLTAVLQQMENDGSIQQIQRQVKRTIVSPSEKSR